MHQLEEENAKLRKQAAQSEEPAQAQTRKLADEDLAEDTSLRQAHTDLVQAAEAAERSARGHPGNEHFRLAAMRYREQAADALHQLHASWTPPRKELLVERRLQDAVVAGKNAGAAREAAEEQLRKAQEHAEEKRRSEREAEDRITELRVELEQAQRLAAAALAAAEAAARGTNTDAGGAAPPAEPTAGGGAAGGRAAAGLESLPTDADQAAQLLRGLLRGRPEVLLKLGTHHMATAGPSAASQSEDDGEAKRRKAAQAAADGDIPTDAEGRKRSARSRSPKVRLVARTAGFTLDQLREKVEAGKLSPDDFALISRTREPQDGDPEL